MVMHTTTLNNEVSRHNCVESFAFNCLSHLLEVRTSSAVGSTDEASLLVRKADLCDLSFVIFPRRSGIRGELPGSVSFHSESSLNRFFENDVWIFRDLIAFLSFAGHSFNRLKEGIETPVSTFIENSGREMAISVSLVACRRG